MTPRSALAWRTCCQKGDIAVDQVRADTAFWNEWTASTPEKTIGATDRDQRDLVLSWSRRGTAGTECGGEGGIRTHGGVSPTPVFKTGALNRSATSPARPCIRGLPQRKMVYARPADAGGQGARMRQIYRAWEGAAHEIPAPPVTILAVTAITMKLHRSWFTAGNRRRLRSPQVASRAPRAPGAFPGSDLSKGLW